MAWRHFDVDESFGEFSEERWEDALYTFSRSNELLYLFKLF